MGKREELPVRAQIDDIARDSLARAKNDLVQAAQIMERHVRADNTLFHELMDSLVYDACYGAVGRALGADRSKSWNSTRERELTQHVNKNVQRVVRLAASNTNLMLFPLFGGKTLLKDATRDQVLESAEKYSGMASDAGVKSRWLKLIAQKLESKKTVSQCLNEQQLVRLQKEAANA